MLKVVVPLDGSRLSEAALARLSRLKPLGLGGVTLVYVLESFLEERDPRSSEERDPRSSEEYEERQRTVYTAYLRDVAEKLAIALGCDVHTEVRFGKPEAEIRKAASAADLVVMTTHGRSGVTRVAIGSVADGVIRQAEVPVLVIGREAVQRDAGREIHRILVPLDGSELAEQALPLAESWAKAFGAGLHLVRVVNIVPIAAGDPVNGYYTPELLQALQESALTYLQSMTRRPGLGDAVTGLKVGMAAGELMSYSVENMIDLVVMTSHGRRGAVRTILGSTTDRMLHGPAPVLVVPAKLP